MRSGGCGAAGEPVMKLDEAAYVCRYFAERSAAVGQDRASKSALPISTESSRTDGRSQTGGRSGTLRRVGRVELTYFAAGRLT